MRRSMVLALLVLLSTALGCTSESESTQCTPRQHFEIMQRIQRSSYYFFHHPPVPLYIKIAGTIDHLTHLGISKPAYLIHLRNEVKKICTDYGVPYQAFNQAHKKYGFLGLTYSQALKELVKVVWNINFKKPDPGGVKIEDERVNGWVNLEDDLQIYIWGEGAVVIVVTEDGDMSIHGLRMGSEELYEYFEYLFPDYEDYEFLEEPPRYFPVCHIRTQPQTQAGEVFGIMDILFTVSSQSKIHPPDFRGKKRFIFSQPSPTSSRQFKVSVDTGFTKPDPGWQDSADHLIYLEKSGKISLDGEPLSGIQALPDSFNAKGIDPEDMVYLAVDDEVLWERVLDILELNRRHQLMNTLRIRRASRLEGLEPTGKAE